MDNFLIKGLLLDVGGVLMSNGWDHQLREQIAQKFGIEQDEMNERHAMFFDVYERDKMSFDEYLTRSIFYKERSFSLEALKQEIFSSVVLYHETVDWIKRMKKEHHLRVGLVSNEGRALAEDRFQRFDLSFVDFFSLFCICKNAKT